MQSEFETIDGYKVLRKIGEGGYGIALLVKNESEEHFILKFINPKTPTSQF